jgi:hypothetical protein
MDTFFYVNNNWNLQTLDYMLGSGQTVTKLHYLPPRQVSPLTHNIMFPKNSFSLQRSKTI